MHTFLITVDNENTELYTLGKGEQKGKCNGWEAADQSFILGIKEMPQTGNR